MSPHLIRPRWFGRTIRRSCARTKRAFMYLLGGCVTLPVAQAEPAGRVLEALFQPDRVAGAALSRDGAHVAFALRDGRDVRFLIHDTSRPDAVVRTAVDSRSDTRLGFLGWAGPGLLLASTDEPALVAINASDGTIRRLLDARSLPPVPRGAPRPILRVLGLTPDERSLLVEITVTALGPRGQRVDLLEVALDSHEQRQVPVAPPTSAGSWMIDQQGNPRLWWSGGLLPRRFHLRAAGQDATTWTPLDQACRDKPSLRSDLTPQSYLGERSLPLAFDADPQVLYLASNVDRDTHALHALDLRTGRRTRLAVDAEGFDLVDLDAPGGTASPLIFDRGRRTLVGVHRTGLAADTHWLDTELRGVQADVAGRFPGRDIRLLEWDDARSRFLVHVTAVSRPGRYFVFHRTDARLVEYARQLDLDLEVTCAVEPFEFTTGAGRRTTGYLTLPDARRSIPPALVVWLHDGPCARVAPEFQREAQALAAMGFAVVQVHYAGSAGFGRRTREAIRDDFDQVPVDDLVATLAHLAPRRRFDAQRVAVGGRGFGGYLALRATQLRPDLFKGAVALNPILDPASLARPGAGGATRPPSGFRPPATPAPSVRAPQSTGEGEAAESSETSAPPPPEPDFAAPAGPEDARGFTPVDFPAAFAAWYFAPARRQDGAVDEHLEQFSRPVLLGCDTRDRRADIDAVRALHTALTRRRQPAAWVDLPASLERASPGERAALFRRIGRFLTDVLGEEAAP